MILCSKCNLPTKEDLDICDPCYESNLKSLLNSPHWIEMAKTRKGDLPNETLFDSVKSEHVSLKERNSR